MVVDEVTTWKEIQPTALEYMAAAEGAAPGVYADMATAFPHLFANAEAARTAFKAMRADTPEIPLLVYLIEESPGYRLCRYHPHRKKGPRSALLYDPHRIMDPAAWLEAKLGPVDVELLSVVGDLLAKAQIVGKAGGGRWVPIFVAPTAREMDNLGPLPANNAFTALAPRGPPPGRPRDGMNPA